ncbi:MAG: cytidine deaminase [Bacteroidia bacterium]|nr:cytidine deaminase [Bacteroidia bacterium]MDW8133945.1 cytidine deaminase [Bacteroidia bacterium]
MRRSWCMEYEELGWDELSERERLTLRAAVETAKQAYAPYSNFPVGAAAYLRKGDIWIGNNQENAAYPSGLCAERTLLFSLGAHNLVTEIEIVAVYASASLLPIMPCGACRQVMYEYQQRSENPWTLIFAGAADFVYRMKGVESLLPLAFVWRRS